jgi:hypothetical protein
LTSYFSSLKRSEEEPRVEQLKQQVTLLTSEVKEWKSKGDGLNNDMTKLKQEKTDLADHLVIILFTC